MSEAGLLLERARPLPEPRRITPGLTTGDKVFRFALCALVANITLNLILVPEWGVDLGISGAALAFLTTESVLCILLWVTLPSATTTAPAQPSGTTDATHT